MNKTITYAREYIAKFSEADIYSKLWIIFASAPFITVVIYALRLLWGTAQLAFTSPNYFFVFSLSVAFTLCFAFIMVTVTAIVVMALADGFEKARKSLSAAIVLICVATGLVFFELALLEGLGVTWFRSL